MQQKNYFTYKRISTKEERGLQKYARQEKALKKYAESLKFELGVAQTYYQGGRQRNQVY